MKLALLFGFLLAGAVYAQEDRPVRYFPNDPPQPGCSVITPLWNNWNVGGGSHSGAASAPLERITEPGRLSAKAAVVVRALQCHSFLGARPKLTS